MGPLGLLGAGPGRGHGARAEHARCRAQRVGSLTRRWARRSTYGIFDVGRNEGWDSVGISADTAQFAAAAINGWWAHLGKQRYPDATTLTITADCGGSNSYRVRL